jgi:protein-disulfide isomerase
MRMKNVKILGTGCANCQNTCKLVDEDLKAIMALGVMSTPGVVIDGKVVHAGGVPARSKVEGWFA